MTFIRNIVLPIGLFAPGIALAQIAGSLSYGSVETASFSAPTPVPIPLLYSLCLGAAIAAFGFRALRGRDRHKLVGALLLSVGAGIVSIGSLSIQEAIAGAIVELTRPEGGSVDVPIGNVVYTNASGVALKIGSVIVSPSCAKKALVDECVSGLVLADSESCSTEYSCTGSNDVPPVRGESGRTNLLGTDLDGDGVRDDVQRFIVQTYGDSSPSAENLSQLSRLYQRILSQSADPIASKANARMFMRLYECQSTLTPDTTRDIVLGLESKFLNTEERSRAYIEYSASLAGGYFEVSPLEEWSASCASQGDKGEAM